MKRLTTLTIGLLLLATQFTLVPNARAADLGRVVAAVVEQLPLGALQRRISFCLPYEVSIPGPEGGDLTVSGEGCPSSGGMSLTTTMVYTDYGVAPGTTISGSTGATVELVGDITAGNITSVTAVLNGGPVTYLINGESYVVVFNEFTVSYTDSFAPVSASGSVTVNDVYYPASVELAGYII